MTDAQRTIPSITMVAVMTRQSPGRSTPCATITPADLPALAEVMAIAYKGTVHDVDQTLDHALEYIHQHTAGDVVGPMLWECSFQALSNGVPVGAVFTSLEKPDMPLFFDIYTHPHYRNRGVATALIKRAMNALLDHGFTRVRLRVAIANEGARRLYERLGFRPV